VRLDLGVPTFGAGAIFGFAGAGAGGLGLKVEARFIVEVLPVFVEEVDFLGATRFLTGCFLGGEKSIEPNL